jgi:hypothetical protein
VFLSVFKWEPRKGWDVLLDAYVHEFAGTEPVELHIMTKPFGKGEQVGLGAHAAAKHPAPTAMGLCCITVPVLVLQLARHVYMHLTPTRKQWLTALC